MTATREELWGLISRPGHLELCHPFCAQNPVVRWPGANAVDEVHYLNGWMFERRFERWFDGTGYDLRIGRPGGRVSFVEWRILDSSGGLAALRISVHPYLLRDLPAPLRWVPHVLYVRPMLRKYLDSVTRGVDWYLSRGEPVSNDQFGRHAWFSGSRT